MKVICLIGLSVSLIRGGVGTCKALPGRFLCRVLTVADSEQVTDGYS